jgi:hypothetical protein
MCCRFVVDIFLGFDPVDPKKVDSVVDPSHFVVVLLLLLPPHDFCAF